MSVSVAWLLAALAASQPEEDFEQIAHQVGQVPHGQTLAQLEAFVAQNPSAPQTARALLLGAQLRRLDGRDDLARPLLERAVVIAAGSDSGFDAMLGLCGLDLAERNYGAAIAGYQKVMESSSGRWQYQAGLGLEYARGARTRWWLLLAVVIALVVVGLWRASQALRAGSFWPLPEEARVALPIALLLALASAGQPPSEAHAVQALAAGGAMILWSNAAYFQVAPPLGGRRWFEGFLGIAQAAGLLYCAVVLSGLWEKFAETLSAGPGE